MKTNEPTTPRSMTRREAVWRVCDELAKQGVKPSVSKVRPHHQGGSDTDVHADIQAWFADVFAARVGSGGHSQLPEEVGSLMRQLWSTARSAAEAQLARLSEELEIRRHQVELSLQQLQARLDEALTHGSELQTQLTLEQARADGLSHQVAQARLRETEQQALVHELNLRLQSHEQTIAQQAQRHAEEREADRKAHHEELERVHHAAEQRVEQLQQQTANLQENFRSIERRMLLEIDQRKQDLRQLEAKTRATELGSDAQLREQRQATNAAKAQAAEAMARLEASQEILRIHQQEKDALRLQLTQAMELLSQRFKTSEQESALRPPELEASATPEPAPSKPMLPPEAETEPGGQATPEKLVGPKPSPSERVDESDYE